MSETKSFRVALVQMCSGRDVEANVRDATALIREAAAGGAAYVQTPEATNIMEIDRDLLFAATRPEADDPGLRHFEALARELGIWLHLGSMVVRASADRLANRSFLISPQGAIVARYDKIHMFDVDLANGESYRESANYKPGEVAVLASLPWGFLGLTICYDLRFPQLFRALVQAGATFLAVPAAFTRLTGEAHWHTLLKARAIESQCFAFAAAQGGRHEHGRETFGHSLIISPWGEILAEGGVHPAVISAVVELRSIEDVRTRVPSLRHDRTFEVLIAGGKTAAEAV